MATNISEINDLFLMLTSDYRLNTIYQTSGSAALNTYLEAWLLYSINDFESICNQDLVYDKSTQDFSVNLTQENINMLAQIMVKYWMQKNVQDILQIENSIQDHDFKTYSQAQNLKAKQDYYNIKREEVSQLLIDYGYKYNQWSNWDSQMFSV